MNMPLVLLNRRRRGNVFTPSGLFALAEPGVWYDPSDLTTLFQDTAGTTPVTTPGQTVALALDKSKGLVLGPELVTNGTFNANSSAGWTLNTWTVANNRLEKTAGDNLRASGTLTSALVSGRYYKVTLDASNFATACNVLLRTGVGGTSSTGYSIPSGSATHSFVMQATDAHTVIQFFPASTSFSGTVDNISVRELAGNHATQTTAASRPTYQIDGTGRPYLSFDGVDDFLVTPTITPNIDKVQVFAGVRKLSDAAVGIVAELSAAVSAGAGSFYLLNGTPLGSGPNWASNSRGGAAASSSQAAVSDTSFVSPVTSVLTATHDIAGDLSAMRVNGSANGTNGTADKGVGNFLTYPLYIGRRGGTAFPFNGQLYSLVVRFGANLDANTISQTETWVNSKTGAY